MVKKLVIVVVCALLLLALAEGAARVIVPRLDPTEEPLARRWERPEGEADVQQQLYEADDATFYRLRPGLAVRQTADARLFDVRTNSLGLRGAEVATPKPTGTLRILCVGDSCTFGSGAKTKQAYPARLEALLRERLGGRAVEVVNAGVPGFSSFQGLQLLESVGYGLEPDVVLFVLGVNDSTQAKPGTKRLFDEDLWISDAELADLLAPAPPEGWGLERLVRRFRGDPERERLEAELRDGLGKTRVSMDEYEQNLVGAIEGCRARGITPIVVTWPTEAQAQQLYLRDRGLVIWRYQKRAKETAARLEAELIDLVPAMEGHGDDYIDAVHLNATGYERIAEALAARLVEILGA